MKRTMKDGRVILTGKHYTDFRRSIWDRCEGCCENCGTEMVWDWEIWPNGFHVHHKRGRGGGKRDDTPKAVEGICNQCHRAEHE